MSYYIFEFLFSDLARFQKFPSWFKWNLHCQYSKYWRVFSPICECFDSLFKYKIIPRIQFIEASVTQQE